MPFPFVLPTTSAFIFTTSFSSTSHPSLPLTASTYRSVLRSLLKTYKHLPPPQQAHNLPSLLTALTTYLPFILALDSGLSNIPISYNNTEEVDVLLKTSQIFEWRPVITSTAIPLREPPRIKLDSIEYEILFVLATIAYAESLLARSSLQPLYSTSTASLPQDARFVAIQTATKHFLTAAGIHAYISSRASTLPETKIISLEIAPSTHTALAELALAEATLLAVLKDDPYPTAVAQDRNKNDKEWMIHAPSIPKVRAHLFSRLCIAASEHAAKAHAMLSSSEDRVSGAPPRIGGSVGVRWKISSELLSYTNSLRLSSRAKACRFLGIDSELSNQTGSALAWLAAGFSVLGVSSSVETKSKSGFGLGKLKSGWSERKEGKKVEQGRDWGSDAGKAEEARILEMLEQKWTKQNDTINTQAVPPSAPLLATIPSGREIHPLVQYQPPMLDAETLAEMRAPPDPEAELEEAVNSSEDDEAGGAGGTGTMVGAFPGTGQDYGSASRTGTPGYF